MKKRIGRIFLVVTLTCSMIVTPVFATPSVNDIKENKKAAESQVGSLQSELTALVGKIDILESDLITKGEEVLQADADLKEAQIKQEKQYDDMKLRIKYMYEAGNSTYLEKLLSSTSISELLNQAEYVQNVHKYDRKMLREYVDTKDQIATLKTTLEGEMSNMETMQSDLEMQQKSLSNTIETKKVEVANFDEQLQAAVAEANRVAEAEAQARAQATASRPSNNRPSNNNPSNNKPTDKNDNSNQNINPPSGSGGSAVVSYAMQFLGNPYVYGGTSLTNGTDCSGFTMGVYKAFGISLPRSSSAQRSAGRGVSYEEAQPGDLICYDGHVAIYTGGGGIVHASSPKVGIITGNATYRTILAVRRIL
ncbi:MAG: NlpC/P60 family protein [Lachnospiraceae bacterium]